jgi:CBS domain-containing protein
MKAAGAFPGLPRRTRHIADIGGLQQSCQRGTGGTQARNQRAKQLRTPGRVSFGEKKKMARKASNGIHSQYPWRNSMHISEVMSTDVKIANPKQSIQDAARMMAEIDAGAIPVGEGDRLVGMITDRDIAVRAVAAGKPANTSVSDVMSHEVKYCFESDDVDAVSVNMADLKLRRLPVVNQEKQLVGIVSLADIALSGGPDDAATALSGISEPGGLHSQSESGVHGIEVLKQGR